MAETTKVYENPGNSGGTSSTPKTKVYEQGGKKKAWWLIPLLIIIAALVIWAATRDHHSAPAQVAAVQGPADLHFATGQAALTPESQTTLGHAVDQMKSDPNLMMRIEGYTDSTGSAATNASLSEQRTAAVRDFMTSRGIASSRLTGQGFGDTNPVSTNSTATGKADNRRVQIQLFQKQ